MATQWQRWGVVVLAMAGLGIGACGGGSGDDETSTAGGATEPAPAPGPGGTIEVIGKEFSYNPATITVKAGQPTKIVLKNTGSIEHDITISDAGFKLTVAGNNTREKVLTVEKPGTYQMYCSVAGHKDAGMKGELVAE